MSDTVVNTTPGAVVGVIEDDVAVFRGIPYAAPPFGDNLWRLPQPVGPAWIAIAPMSPDGSPALSSHL